MQSKHNSSLTPFAKELRRNMTKEERHLWYDFLRSYPIKFTRQKVLGKFIVDFYCAQVKLAVELDGSQHYSPEDQKKDSQRTEFLKNYDITVIRIPNNEVMTNFLGVCEYIHHIVSQLSTKERQSEKG